MTKKVKVFLAVLLIVSIAGMGYSYRGVILRQDIPGRTVRDSGAAPEGTPETADLAAPHYIIAGVGTYEYKIADRKTELPDDVVLEGAVDSTAYASFLKALEQILDEGDSPETVDTASESIISESFSQGSLTALFEYEVPFSEFLSYHGIRTGSARQVGAVSRISLLEDGTLLLYRASDQAYYRYPPSASNSGGSAEKLAGCIQFLYDSAGEESGRLQSVTSLTGIENNTYIPVAASINAAESDYSGAFRTEDPADREYLKSLFFPDGMDFVNEVAQADGSRIYMYGPGERVLRLAPSGSFKYQEEPDMENYRAGGFYEAVDAVAAGLLSSGVFAERLSMMDLYIRDVEKISMDSRGGYRIVFGASVNGMDIMTPGEPLLSADVYGKQITSVTGNIPDGSALNHLEAPAAAVDGVELIRSSSDAVASIILESSAGDNSVNTEKYTANDNFYAVAASITGARLCLVTMDALALSSAGEEETAAYTGRRLVPAWFFAVDGMEFWFDAENGTLLTYRKAEKS